MKIAFTNCTVLDGTKDMSPIENAVVVIEGSKILSVNANNHIPSDVSVINLGGRFLMPVSLICTSIYQVVENLKLPMIIRMSFKKP